MWKSVISFTQKFRFAKLLRENQLISLDMQKFVAKRKGRIQMNTDFSSAFHAKTFAFVGN